MHAHLDVRQNLHAFVVQSAATDTTDRRMIYRNNYFFALCEALSATYPVIEQLVGEPFFRAMSQEFILKNPPGNPVLAEYGAEFSTFLKAFPPVAELAYLSDVAQLEWERQRANIAADGKLLDLALLLQESPEALTEAQFKFLPSVSLLTVRWPVLEIWHANQEGEIPEVELVEQDRAVMIWRPNLSVQMSYMDQAQHQFIQILMNGTIVADAFMQTLAQYPNFDLSEMVRKLVSLDCLANDVFKE